MLLTDPAESPQRYTRMAIFLHWFVGLAVIGQIVFGFLLDSLAPRGTPARGDVINLHKSVGIVLLVPIALRLLWRLAHRPPAWPTTLSLAQQRAATWGHRALYACMVVMPLTGYTASNFSKHGVKFFGTRLAPWGPDLPQVYELFNAMHVATAFLLTALIAGHVMIALKHALIDHDGVFSRMWPRRAR